MRSLADLERQHLAGTLDATPADLVEALAGLNAQSVHGPSVGLWTRTAVFDQAGLDDELRSYRLVKASLMRGTVHLVTRRQFLTWRAALQPALERVVRGFCPRLWQQVDHDRLLKEAAVLIGDSDGLTRQQIGDRLAGYFPGADPKDLGFAVRTLAPLVQVPAPGSSWAPRRTRYALASSVLGEPLVPAVDGLPDLVSAYLRSFGPAGVADAAYWSGLSGLRPVLAASARTLPGPTPRRPAFDLDVPVATERPRRAFVLPEFDNVYFSAAQLPEGLAGPKRRLMYGAALMRGSFVVDGQVVAQWTASQPAGRPVLEPWADVRADLRKDGGAMAEWDRFADWWARTARAAGT